MSFMQVFHWSRPYSRPYDSRVAAKVGGRGQKSTKKAGKLQLTLTDHVNIGPDSPKMHSYQQAGPSGTPALSSLFLPFSFIQECR